MSLGKKKKYAKRIVKKAPNPKKEEAQKRQQNDDNEVFMKAFEEIQNGVIDVFSNAKFF